MSRPLLTISAIFAVWLMLGMQTAPGQDNPDAIWKKTELRIRSMRDYTLTYRYHGNNGDYVFDYAAVRPDATRTRIVQGSNRGVVLILNPDEYGPEVKARKGFFGTSMSVKDARVAGTPIVRPVYDLLLDDVKGSNGVKLRGEAVVSGHAAWMLDVDAPGGVHEVAVDKVSYDVLQWKYSDSSGPHDLMFYDVKVNVHPRIVF